MKDPVQSQEVKDDINDLIRTVNRANATDYSTLPAPEYIHVAETGSYTVGLMDSINIELLCFDPMHVEIIENVALAIKENTELHRYLRETPIEMDKAFTIGVELDHPLTNGARVIHLTTFTKVTWSPAVISLLERSPLRYTIVSLSHADGEQAFIEMPENEL